MWVKKTSEVSLGSGSSWKESKKNGGFLKFKQKFLNLWKDADPGLPEDEGAKRRLAGLKGS